MLYRRLTIEELDYDAARIESERLFNVFVFGVARSGTSMMAGIVERLGVKMVHTSDTPEALAKRKAREDKRYGGGYEMNPDGFFEITDNPWLHYQTIMATPYSGCKMIVPVDRGRMSVVRFNPCARVIQMWRDPEEIRQSQQAAYGGDKAVSDERAEEQRAKLRYRLVEQKQRLDKLGVSALHVEYQAVLADPLGTVAEVAVFIRSPNAIDEAVAWVDRSKNRFRAADLEPSI